MSKYAVKVGKRVHRFGGLDNAMAFAQKESWDKAHPVHVVKPDGKTIEVNVTMQAS